MFSKFKKIELFILILSVVLIFVSEYIFVIEKQPMRAIFIGLWPPTMLILLIYLNTKFKN
jgi:energy-coupling factor transporter transmembrane protein EcfT